MPALQVANKDLFVYWAASDRAAWEQACASATDPLADHSRIAAWSASTRRAAFGSINNFIAWIATNGQLPPPDGSVADAVDRHVLVDYIKHCAKACKLTTTRTYVLHIISGLELFRPERDWKWAWQLYWKLKATAEREPREPRMIVHGRTLFELGVRMIREAWPVVAWEDACRYRNGLAVILLAAAPLRISNFGTLRLGRHVRRAGERWNISLEAAETKTHASNSWVLSAMVSGYLDRYLQLARPILLKARMSLAETDQLWIGDSGRPVGPQIVRRWINKATEAGLGVRISPHSFRHCAATTYSVERPSRSVEASALLGHASLAATERSYIMQQRQIAQSDYLALLSARCRRACSPAIDQGTSGAHQ